MKRFVLFALFAMLASLGAGDAFAQAAETRMSFETSIALYQKGLELVRMASRAPGR